MPATAASIRLDADRSIPRSGEHVPQLVEMEAEKLVRVAPIGTRARIIAIPTVIHLSVIIERAPGDDGVRSGITNYLSGTAGVCPCLTLWRGAGSWEL